MQYTVITAIVLALGVNIIHCHPTANRQGNKFSAKHISNAENSFSRIFSRQSSPPSADDISNGANLWAQDTSRVSSFLSTGGSMTGSALTSAASTALSNELDEGNQKAVLDAAFLNVDNPVPGVVMGDMRLGAGRGGPFDVVVAGLQYLAQHGTVLSEDDVNIQINNINIVRCQTVLPAINEYFQAAADFLNNGIVLQANPPDNCPPS